MKRLVLVLALAVAGCNAPAATPVMHTIVGHLTVSDRSYSSSIIAVETRCYGSGGYSDLKEGATVTLSDQSSTILASTALGPGVGSKAECAFPFALIGVPDTASFYVIEVSHRGQISKSHAEMVTDGWVFELTLGT